ncbi:MAG TPA: cyclic peptide export ABC transporter [Thermoanaerobaculia bacterium]|nr:cyclic peptide export ABC transporter [Thermoanaerobaculia bacterium]
MKDFGYLIAFLGRCAKGLRGSRGLVPLVVVTAFASGAVSAGFIMLITMILNHRGSHRFLLWSFVGLLVALPALRFTSNVLLLRLVQRALLDLRLKLCRSILATPLRRLEQIGPARLLAMLSEDVIMITNTFGNVPVMILHLGVIVSTLVFLGFLSWKLLLVLLAFVVVGLLSYQMPLIKAQRQFQLMRDAWDKVFQALRGLTEGGKELMIHARRRRSFLERVVEPAVESLRLHSVAGGTIYAAANSWGQTLFFVLIGLVLFELPALAGSEARVLGGFTLGILYLMTPFDTLLNLLPEFGRAAIAAKKVEQLGTSLEAGSPASDALELMDRAKLSWSKLELVGVTHTYFTDADDEPFTLGPLDLSFRSGELVFIMGGNGSGKTTLAKLLIGLYPPESGTLRLDGCRITDQGREAYRQLFSVVFSDFFLFETLLGLESQHLDEQARQHLVALQLERKVKVVGGKLSTLDLSQGQRKRLALLTAYLEDRPIYLFDEWAADQDPHFKEIFYLQLLPSLRARGKTVFVISHDDLYCHVADRILKLDYGRIEHDGDAESLRQGRADLVAAVEV